MTWADVPFYIRAGNALARTALEVIVEFQSPPRLLFSAHRCQPDPNFLRFRLGRHDGVSLGVQVKQPGERIVSEPVELDVDFEHALGARQQDYERLLGDALDGDSTRFAREDAIEQAWRVVQPLLDQPGPVHRYRPGSWGPPETDLLMAGQRGWRNPAS